MELSGVDINETIYLKHITKLRNLDVPNKKLIICFSGTPGSGKSIIARRIEDRYNGIRIENDEIRKIIHEMRKKSKNNEGIDQKKAIEEYLAWILRKISTHEEIRNRLIILDSSIDRRYEAVKKIAEELGFHLFVISLDVHPNKVIERIMKRNKAAAKGYIDRMDGWVKDKEEFRKNNEADITIDNNESPDLNNLFLVLDKIVK